MSLSKTAVPVLDNGFRLQYEPAQEAHVLLYPEGMVKLNQAAAEILTRCDGNTSIEGITTLLEEAFGEDDLSSDVMQFMEVANGNGWLNFS